MIFLHFEGDADVLRRADGLARGGGVDASAIHARVRGQVMQVLPGSHGPAPGNVRLDGARVARQRGPILRRQDVHCTYSTPPCQSSSRRSPIDLTPPTAHPSFTLTSSLSHPILSRSFPRENVILFSHNGPILLVYLCRELVVH